MSRGLIRPALVGSDIGCGMALWQTDLTLRRLDPETLAARCEGLDAPWDGDTRAWLDGFGLAPTPFDASLGTVGSGNHFAEVQAVAEIRDAGALERLCIDPARALVLVHTGSRGLGESILRAHADRFRAEGLPDDGPEAGAYRAAHDRALAWARANRALVAERLMEAIGAWGQRVLDICHNAVVERSVDGCRCQLHRKGAAPADQGPAVIPGSRGDVSVLVEPVPDRRAALWSLAHGAGRKLARHEAKGKLAHRYRRAELTRNRFGGIVVCGDERLLWEEAPGAYKDAARVVGDLEEAGLVRVLAVLHPRLTFKCSRAGDGEARRDKAERLRERRAAREAKRGRDPA